MRQYSYEFPKMPLRILYVFILRILSLWLDILYDVTFLRFEAIKPTLSQCHTFHAYSLKVGPWQILLMMHSTMVTTMASNASTPSIIISKFVATFFA